MSDWPSLQWQLIRPYGRQIYYSIFPGHRPDYFRKPWSYPPARPAGATGCVFLPMTDWHARLQRSQHLAACVASAGCETVYVNPHLGLEYPTPYLFSPGSRLLELAPRLLEQHVHLPREHELHRRPFTAAESRRIARALDPMARGGAALVVSFPAWLPVAEELRAHHGCRILYDCHDWLPGFGRTPAALLEMEGALFRSADAVIFSSQFLQELVLKTHDVGAKSALIRNAADPFPAPPAPPPRSKPAIGYVGALDHWFDTAAVAAVARAHPEWRVVLAGRVEHPPILELRERPNVEFLGEVPRRELPALFAQWDAAMIPFLVNDLTLAANPIKLYEYFAAGLPVVSAKLPEVEMYGDLVYLAGTADEFASMASRAVAESDTRLRERRIAAASRETWPARAEQLLSVIRSL